MHKVWSNRSRVGWKIHDYSIKTFDNTWYEQFFNVFLHIRFKARTKSGHVEYQHCRGGDSTLPIYRRECLKNYSDDIKISFSCTENVKLLQALLQLSKSYEDAGSTAKSCCLLQLWLLVKKVRDCLLFRAGYSKYFRHPISQTPMQKNRAVTADYSGKIHFWCNGVYWKWWIESHTLYRMGLRVNQSKGPQSPVVKQSILQGFWIF